MTQQNLTIYSWNINGLRAIVRKNFINWFNKTQPDILCLQEIKTQAKDLPTEVLQLKNYQLYINSADKKGYAGTAVLTKIKPLKIINSTGIKIFDQEGRVQVLEFDKFYLINTYFPNAQAELKRLDFKIKFNQKYLKFLNKFNNKPLILTGDFNVAHQEIDLANPNSNHFNAGFTDEERQFINQIIKSNFVDTFRHLHPQTQKYSYWTYRFGARQRNVGWRIDYFFISKKIISQIKKAEILTQVIGSDHCPITIAINL
ncbi:MAG: exodeoxyribonuclease III [Patescibacteria group bacterium]|nr:exodeoxyribonuclease III [Patescibacteria group bacterium]